MDETDVEPFALAVALMDDCNRAGAAVVVEVRLRNAGTEPATIEHWSDWFEYEYGIRGPDGRELPRTRFGNLRYRERDVAVTGRTVLAAGETHTHRVLLSRIFDCTLTGRYELSLARDLRDPQTGEWTTVRSNTLAFELRDA